MLSSPGYWHLGFSPTWLPQLLLLDVEEEEEPLMRLLWLTSPSSIADVGTVVAVAHPVVYKESVSLCSSISLLIGLLYLNRS